MEDNSALLPAAAHNPQRQSPVSFLPKARFPLSRFECSLVLVYSLLYFPLCCLPPFYMKTDSAAALFITGAGLSSMSALQNANAFVTFFGIFGIVFFETPIHIFFCPPPLPPGLGVRVRNPLPVPHFRCGPQRPPPLGGSARALPRPPPGAGAPAPTSFPPCYQTGHRPISREWTRLLRLQFRTVGGHALIFRSSIFHRALFFSPLILNRFSNIQSQTVLYTTPHNSTPTTGLPRCRIFPCKFLQ